MLHGGDIYGTGEALGIACDEVIDFSANISPLGLPASVRAAVIDSLDGAVHYPDVKCRRLRRAISAHMSEKSDGDITPEMILCGSGAADIIYRLVYAVRPKRALVLAPSFVEYEAALFCTGTEIDYYNLNHDGFVAGEDILEAVTEAIDIIFVCTPNNPTGVLTDRALLLKIAKKAKAAGALLVIDECFLDFVKDEAAYTMTGFLRRFENVLVLRSFTKMFAMPGLRLGFCMCANQALLDKMAACGQSWAVSTAAEAAGLAALAEETYAQEVTDYVAKERVWLYERLAALGVGYTESAANYILIRVPSEKKLYEKLLGYGIMIRRCENYVNLDGTYYRIAVNSHDKNKRLIAALSEILGSGGSR